jgi:hypothetical protein
MAYLVDAISTIPCLELLRMEALANVMTEKQIQDTVRANVGKSVRVATVGHDRLQTFVLSVGGEGCRLYVTGHTDYIEGTPYWFAFEEISEVAPSQELIA